MRFRPRLALSCLGAVLLGVLTASPAFAREVVETGPVFEHGLAALNTLVGDQMGTPVGPEHAVSNRLLRQAFPDEGLPL